MAELFANDPSTTLNGAINDSTTSVTVTSGTGFPGSGNFRIRIGNELMLVTGVSGNTWTVTRGIENTTAASHGDGATVNHYLTAGALTQLFSDRGSTLCDTLANRPSPATAGRIFCPTDGGFKLYDTGAAWQPTGEMFFRGTMPPAVSTLSTTVNAGSITATDENDGMMVVCKGLGNTNENWGALLTTVPTAPYTLTIGLQLLSVSPTAWSYFGICAYETSSGKAIHWGPAYTTAQTITLTYDKYTNTSTYNSSYTQASQSFPGQNGRIFLRFQDDNTNRIATASVDGKNFDPFVSSTIGRTDFLTPSHIGIMCGQSTNSLPTTFVRYRWKIFHWSVT